MENIRKDKFDSTVTVDGKVWVWNNRSDDHIIITSPTGMRFPVMPAAIVGHHIAGDESVDDMDSLIAFTGVRNYIVRALKPIVEIGHE